MKRILSFILICCLCLSLAACGTAPEQTEDGKLTIVTTIFPEYDWLRNLTAGSDGVEVQLLIDKGVDLHSYQPSVRDIVTISTCDVFIYTGGASDVWVKDALDTAMNEDMTVIDLMEVLEQHRELCAEDDHDHEHDGHDEHDDHEHTADEHIWLSLVNAGLVCHALTEQLQVLDSDNSALYAENYLRYSAEIAALHEQYAETVAAAKYEDIVFADRFPFTYMMEDYGLHHHAAYEGCSAETEVGFETFALLADTVDALGVDHVVVIDDSDLRIAKTVIASSDDQGRGICTMQSMQAVSRKQIDDGITYLDIMEQNLAVLQQVLN